MNQKPKLELEPALKVAIDQYKQRFPLGHEASALIQALKYAQAANENFLSLDLIYAVAEYLQVPEIQALEVASFYSMFNLKPVAKYQIKVCNNLSCYLRGSETLVESLKHKLKLANACTEDGKFSIEEQECLALCDKAPCLQINDKYYYQVQSSDLAEILEQLD